MPRGMGPVRRRGFSDPFSVPGPTFNSVQDTSNVTLDDLQGPSDWGYHPDGGTPPPAPKDPPMPDHGGSPDGPQPPPSKKYAPIQGFDFDKITGAKPFDSAQKYSDSLRAFSNYLGEGGKIARNDMGEAVAWLRKNGFPNAKAVGDDRLDFGDGEGGIDVITSSGDIWFQNDPDRYASGNATAMGMTGVPGFQVNQGSSGGGGYSSASSSSSSRPSFDANSLKEALAGLFPNGAFNQDIVNRRVDNVRGSVQGARKSRLANNQALLAERGLLGSGPEGSAYRSMDTDLFNAEIGGINEAYADEGRAADSRMMQALSLATGMTAAEAQAAIDQYRAETDRTGVNNAFTLGQGRLALDKYLGDQSTGLGYYKAGNDFTLGRGRLAIDNMDSVNQYNLGLGRLGLDRDRLQYDMQGGDLDRLMVIIQQLFAGANTSAGGYR